MSNVNHAGYAQAFIDPANQSMESLSEKRIAIAQVHATLALVEQQRLANIIALGNPQTFDPQSTLRMTVPSYGLDGKLKAEIRDGLGL